MTSKNPYFFDLPVLETKRLKLKKILISDAPSIFEYASIEKVTRYLSWNTHETIEDTKNFIFMVTQNYMDGEPSSWAMHHKEDKKVIGTIGFVDYNSAHKRGEVGFALSEKYWNQGITSEALQKVMEFGFNELELERIEARCYPENAASEKVLLKAGFKYEGLLRNHIIVNSVCIDLKIFSVLKSDYLNQTIR